MIMDSITYLTRQTKMGYNQIINLPYPIFLKYLRDCQIENISSTEEGRKIIRRSQELTVKTPDFAKLRQAGGYKTTGGEQ